MSCRFFILTILVLFLSCKKDVHESTFVISIKEISPVEIVEFKENIFVTLRYEHPDGYVGFSDPDRLSLEVKDSRLENPDYFHLIPVNPPNHSLSVQGEILIEIDSPFLFGNADTETLRFLIRIQDTKMNWSNQVMTSDIIINRE
jgi:hypothetical protein